MDNSIVSAADPNWARWKVEGKVRICNYFGKCTRGLKCSFAHTRRTSLGQHNGILCRDQEYCQYFDPQRMDKSSCMFYHVKNQSVKEESKDEEKTLDHSDQPAHSAHSAQDDETQGDDQEIKDVETETKVPPNSIEVKGQEEKIAIEHLDLETVAENEKEVPIGPEPSMSMGYQHLQQQAFEMTPRLRLGQTSSGFQICSTIGNQLIATLNVSQPMLRELAYQIHVTFGF